MKKEINNFLDNKLEQIQEGHPILFSISALALLVAAKSGWDRYKIEKFLNQHKDQLDKLMEKAKKNSINKIYNIGIRLYKEITTKYTDIYPKLLYEGEENVSKLKNRSWYEEEVPSYFRKIIREVLGERGQTSGFFRFANLITDDIPVELNSKAYALLRLESQANRKVDLIIKSDVQSITNYIRQQLSNGLKYFRGKGKILKEVKKDVAKHQNVREIFYIVENLFDKQMLEEKQRILLEMNINNLKNVYEDRKKKLEEIFKKFGINKEYIVENSKKIKKQVLNLYKMNKSSEEAAKNFSEETGKKIILEVKKRITRNDQTLSDNLIFILCVIFTVVVFELAFDSLFAEMFSKNVANVLNITLFGPAIEELMKNYFIETGVPWLGTAVFAGIEGLMYVIALLAMGISLPRALLYRAIGFIFHMITTLLQKKFGEKVMKDDDSSKTKNKKNVLMWLIGFICHALYNTIAYIIYLRT